MRRGAVGARVWEVCVFCHAYVVSCVHPVTVLNDEFCMTCSLLMLVDDHMEEEYPQVAMSVILFTPSCCGKCFYHL